MFGSEGKCWGPGKGLCTVVMTKLADESKCANVGNKYYHSVVNSRAVSFSYPDMVERNISMISQLVVLRVRAISITEIVSFLSQRAPQYGFNGIFFCRYRKVLPHCSSNDPGSKTKHGSH
jgi:hypothetical protein